MKKLDEKMIEEEFEIAKEKFELRRGKKVNFRLMGGCGKQQYEGIFLGEDDLCIYLSDVNVSEDATKRKYVKVYKDKIKAQTFDKEFDKE